MHKKNQKVQKKNKLKAVFYGEEVKRYEEGYS
jgi:hypothetical protein